MRIVYWARVNFVQATLMPLLEREPDIDLTVVQTLDELAAALPGADGLIAIDCTVELADRVRALLHAPATTLRWLHVLSAGREGFIAADVPASITITGPAGAHSPALAEHLMGFMLAWTRRTPEFARATAKHEWDRGVAPLMGSLEGRTLAIIGLGHAGHELAKRARPFGMHVIAATRTPKSDPLVDEMFPLEKLHDVLRRADYIAITIAQTPETEKLLGPAEFAACKPTAYLTNIARGAIIDQAALLDALVTGKIAGAGIDVTEPEPLPAGDPLWDAPNLIISPHVAGGTSPFSQQRLAERVIENLAKFRTGTLVPT
jgi:phosphoglycerate dehydrogenase-like enzyme